MSELVESVPELHDESTTEVADESAAGGVAGSGDAGPDDAGSGVDGADDTSAGDDGTGEGVDGGSEGSEYADEVDELFTKSDVESMTFNYRGPPDELKLYKVFIKGDDWKVQLPDDTFINENGYDTVYFNVNSDTATGYCERKKNRCDDDGPLDIDSEDYKFMTPLNWKDEVVSPQVYTSENIDKKSAVRITFENKAPHVMWIDEYTGLPLLVHVGEGEDLVKYEYQDLTINTVKDSDVRHQD